jgi:hypothetical protein
MAPRFRVTLLVGQELHAIIPARNEQAAEDIATYLFEERPGLLTRGPRDIVDWIVEPADEVAS